MQLKEKLLLTKSRFLQRSSALHNAMVPPSAPSAKMCSWPGCGENLAETHSSEILI